MYSPGETQYSLLRLPAMAARWPEPARDALDKLVLGCETNPNGVDLKSIECIEQLDYLPFDPVLKRTEGTVKDKRRTCKWRDAYSTQCMHGEGHVLIPSSSLLVTPWIS